MNMDWERKFTSILKDTEANLSRVKNKFNGHTNNVTWAPRSYSTPMKRSTSLVDFQTLGPSTSPLGYMSGFSQSLGSTSVYPGPSHTYPSIQTLQEKIEQQTTAIEHLTGLVHRLETDRHNYKEQIRDLRNEVYQLTERSHDRRPDPSTERRMEQVRRELLGEIQLLQSQLQISAAKGSNSHLSDTQLLSLNRDFMEIKHAYRDELEGLRRDTEVLRSRMAKVELELAGIFSGKRETDRRQDNLDRALSSLTYTQQKSQPQLPPSTLALMNTNRQLEKLQINELRATLAALKNKIDVLESNQPITSSTPYSTEISSNRQERFSNGVMSIPPTADDGDDDIDLSDIDSESSDFTEFDPGLNLDNKTKKKDDDLDTIPSDDLDLDNLDLSDDDDVLLSDK